MSETIPEGGVFEVRILFKMTCAATHDEIEAWANHDLCQSGGLSLDNPLLKSPPEAISDVYLTDTKKRHFSIEYDHIKTGENSTSYKRRCWVEPDERRRTP